MKLQELTTEELMTIDGGGSGNFIYYVFYGVGRAFRFVYDSSESLEGNPNFGNATVYK